MLDPNTNTRREFTDNMTNSFTIPDDAAKDWKSLAENLKELIKKLAYHDAMKPNIDQSMEDCIRSPKLARYLLTVSSRM